MKIIQIKGLDIKSSLFLPLKAASHYTAYNAINVILTELIANSAEQGYKS